MKAQAKPRVEAMRELPDRQTINGYGPTENTTFTCCYRLPKTWSGGLSVPPDFLDQLFQVGIEPSPRVAELKPVTR